jgi:hypothetical protein
LYENYCCGQHEAKLKRHLETVNAEGIGKAPEFFCREQNEFNKQKQVFSKITTVTSEL